MLRINPKKRVEKESEETDNFRGGGGWEDHEHYFRVKRQKLRQQFSKDSALHQDINSSETSILFSNCTFYVDGRTDPPIDFIKLRDLLYKHGGKVEQYYSSKLVTHVIANQLATAKEKEYTKMKSNAPILVKPQWVLDCIEQNQLLSPVLYSCCAAIPEKNNFFVPKQVQQQQQQQPNYRNAATDPNFIENFFKSSRLHFIGSWKSKVAQYAKQLQAATVTTPQEEENQIHFIIHLDMDCFFANVALIEHPEWKTEPVAVAHTQDNSSEISSCNYVARQYGVKAGMWLKGAKELCPNLKVLPYDFEKYETIALQIVDILHRHFQNIQVLSIDECMIEAKSKSNELMLQRVQQVRKEIEDETKGCTCSAGISHNMLLARMATGRAKPNGQYLIDTFDKKKVQEFLKDMPIDQLPLVGRRTKKLLQQHFEPMETCEHLLTISKIKLQQILGSKKGELLYQYCRGVDNRILTDTTAATDQQQKKSVGCDVNYGIRFTEISQVNMFLEKLALELSQRCKTENLMGKHLSLKILKRQDDAPDPVKYNGHGYVDVYTKSFSIDHFTNDANEMASIAKNLYKQFRFEPSDLRGIGMHMSKLCWNEQKTDEKNKYIHTTLSQFFVKKNIETDQAVQQEEPKEEEQQDGYLAQFEDLIAQNLGFQTHEPKNPILPNSFSQVNPSVFADLPQNIKDELRQYYSSKANTKKSSNKRKQSSSLGTSKQQVKIDLFAKKSMGKSSAGEMDIDFDVLRELPLEIRRQVLQEWEQVKQNKKPSIIKSEPEQPIQVNVNEIEDIVGDVSISLKSKFINREECKDEFNLFVQTKLEQRDLYSIFLLLKWMRRKAEEDDDSLKSLWNQLLDNANDILWKQQSVVHWEASYALKKL